MWRIHLGVAGQRFHPFHPGGELRGVLMTVLILPLTIPILIMGSGAIDAARQGLPYTSLLLLMAAILVMAIPLAPIAAAAAIRQAMD